MRKLIRYVRSRWKGVYDRPTTRLTLIILGTTLGVVTYFYPIVKTIMNPRGHLSEEQQAYYNKDSLYPANGYKKFLEQYNKVPTLIMDKMYLEGYNKFSSWSNYVKVRKQREQEQQERLNLDSVRTS